MLKNPELSQNSVKIGYLWSKLKISTFEVILHLYFSFQHTSLPASLLNYRRTGCPAGSDVNRTLGKKTRYQNLWFGILATESIELHSCSSKHLTSNSLLQPLLLQPITSFFVIQSSPPPNHTVVLSHAHKYLLPYNKQNTCMFLCFTLLTGLTMQHFRWLTD